MMEIFDYNEASKYTEKVDLEINFPHLQTSDREKFLQDNDLTCEYCDAKMLLIEFSSKDVGYGSGIGKFISECKNCGWWQAQHTEFQFIDEDWTDRQVEGFQGILRAYDLESITVPVNTLRTYVLKKPAMLYDIHPTKMEQLVGAVFKDYFDCEVIHIGKSHDGGIDLLMIDGNQQYVIQVKRRTCTNSVEGVQAISELLGAMILDRKRKGIFVTTADHYSESAVKATRRSKKIAGVTINLIDFKKFVDILKLSTNDIIPHWTKYFDMSAPIHFKFFNKEK